MCRPDIAAFIAAFFDAEAVRRGFGLGPVFYHEAPSADDLRILELERGTIVGNDYLVCHARALQYGPVRRFFTVNRAAQ